MKIMNAAGRAMKAFLSSCAFILGMLTSVAAGLYPYVLPSSTDPALSLTVYNTAAAARYGLEVGLIWFIPGCCLTTAYFVYTYRSFAGKVYCGAAILAAAAFGGESWRASSASGSACNSAQVVGALLR